MTRYLLSAAATLTLALVAGCAAQPGNDDQASTAGAATATENGVEPDDACPTDGCVMQKHAQFDAVAKWAAANDECASVVSWTQQIALVGKGTYAVTCGDSDATEFRVHAEGGGDGAEVVLTQVGEVQVKGITTAHCSTDGCVMRKGEAFAAALAWVASNDECSSVVTWEQSISESTGDDFTVKCGDTSESETITLTATMSEDGTWTAARPASAAP